VLDWPPSGLVSRRDKSNTDVPVIGDEPDTNGKKHRRLAARGRFVD
jgi:hypothetical protein